MRSFLAGLRRLVIPWGASGSQPRIVISTDDPLITSFSNAGISYYWDNGRGFVTAVERSGEGPTAWGQWRLHAVMQDQPFGSRLTQLIDVNVDPVDWENDGVTIWGGSRDPANHNAVVVLRGRALELGSSFSSDEGFAQINAFGESIPLGVRGLSGNVAAANSATVTVIALTTVRTLTNFVFRTNRVYEIRVLGNARKPAAGTATHMVSAVFVGGVEKGRGGTPLTVADVPFNAGHSVYVRNDTAANITANVDLRIASSTAGQGVYLNGVTQPYGLLVHDIGAADHQALIWVPTL